MAILDTPREYRTTHSITVTCIISTIYVDGGADMCVVLAMTVGRANRTGKYAHYNECTFIVLLTSYL